MKKPPISLVSSTSTGTQPPRTLGAPGRELWDSITSEFDISDSGGVALLLLACEATDRIAQLSAQIDTDGCMICGKGGLRAHPALRDELANRAFVVRTLQRLGINVEAIKPQGRPAGWAPPTKGI